MLDSDEIEGFQVKRRKLRNPHVVTVTQAAEMLGLSDGAIRWNITEGYLPAHFDGYKYLVDIDDLRAFKERFYD